MPKSRVFQPPRGTRDFLPEEAEFRRRAEEIIRGVFESYGFREVVTPTFEHFELYSLRSGEEIREEMYVFRGKERERREGRGKPPEYVLRPELTAPICRMYISGGLSTWPKPIKLYYIGRCFRYDRPGPGRYREFWQAGVELIGSPHPEADAEVIALAVDTLKALGLSEYETRIGHLGVLRGILEEGGVNVDVQNRLIKAIDDAVSDLGKMQVGEAVLNGTGRPLTEEDVLNRLESQMEELKIREPLKSRVMSMIWLRGPRGEIVEKAEEAFRQSEKASNALRELDEILTLLEAYGVKDYVVDLSIARGLDYYTGMVFEIDMPRLGGQKQVCGGGRYDRLVSDYGGPETPATGFALGFDRLVEAMHLQGQEPQREHFVDVVVAPASDELRVQAIKIAQRLRSAGVRSDVDLMRRSLSGILAHADRLKIPYAVIVGARELREGKVILRDMKTRSQKTLEVDAAIEELRKCTHEG